MKISFDSLEEQNIQNFKGGEGVFKPRMHVGNYNKIMRANTSSRKFYRDFTHMTPTARSYLSSQELEPWEYDDTMEILNPGDCHCPPGHSHSLKNNGDEDLVFYAVVPEHN